jgi:hypothetical protein
MSLYGGCLLESSIGAATHLHAFASPRTRASGCERFGPQILVDDLVLQPLVYENFHIRVTPGPGLGVVLDEEKLRRYERRKVYRRAFDPTIRPIRSAIRIEAQSPFDRTAHRGRIQRFVV